MKAGFKVVTEASVEVGICCNSLTIEGVAVNGVGVDNEGGVPPQADKTRIGVNASKLRNK